MASPEVAEVRYNTDESEEESVLDLRDEEIQALIDVNGVAKASAVIWRRKASRYAKLVNTSIAGASHDFGDLQDKAIKMAESFESGGAEGTNRVKIHTIDRGSSAAANA